MSQTNLYLAIRLLKRKKINQKALVERIKTKSGKRFKFDERKLSEMKNGHIEVSDRIMALIKQILNEENLLAEFEEQKKHFKLPMQRKEYNSLHRNVAIETKYDLFLSAPRNSFRKKMDRHIEFNNELFQLVNDHTNLNELTAEQIDEFKSALRKKTQIRFFGREIADEEMESEFFNTRVNELRDNLKKKLNLNVAFPRPELTLQKRIITGHPSTDFDDDYHDILASKGYLIISPYPRLFTSAWVGLAIALSFEKPILIITRNRKNDVPYIISDEIGARNLMHKEINSLNEIPSMYEFVQKKFLRKLN